MDTTLIMLIAPLVMAELVMRIIALLSLRKQTITKGPKPMWAVIIILVSFGWVAYFLIARTDE